MVNSLHLNASEKSILSVTHDCKNLDRQVLKKIRNIVSSAYTSDELIDDINSSSLGGSNRVYTKDDNLDRKTPSIPLFQLNDYQKKFAHINSVVKKTQSYTSGLMLARSLGEANPAALSPSVKSEEPQYFYQESKPATEFSETDCLVEVDSEGKITSGWNYTDDIRRESAASDCIPSLPHSPVPSQAHTAKSTRKPAFFPQKPPPLGGLGPDRENEQYLRKVTFSNASWSKRKRPKIMAKRLGQLSLQEKILAILQILILTRPYHHYP
jgi:hypothetical protein